jgi:hypothetical protein
MLLFCRESKENDSTDLEVLNERGKGENKPLKNKNFWEEYTITTVLHTQTLITIQFIDRHLYTVFIVVPCCMLFQFVLYYSNSCTSLHFKTQKSHTKTLKIRPYMFRSPFKPSSGGPWPYFARLLNWNIDLHLL